MAESLLPVRTGMETFPVKYFNFLDPIANANNVLLTEHNRMLYILVESAVNMPYMVYLYRLNLFTSEMTSLGTINMTESKMGPYTYIGGFLVDDEYLYFSVGTGNTVTFIYSYRISTLEFVNMSQYSGASQYNQNYGYMTWKDSHTIVLPTAWGMLFFDTKTFEYTLVDSATSTNRWSTAIGEHKIMMTRSNNTTPSIDVYDMDTQQWSTITLTSAATASVCYGGDGKFYAANTQYLYIIDEATGTVETRDVPWTDVRTISASNGVVFVTCSNSRRIYIYDVHARMYKFIIAPWSIPGWSYSNVTIPFTISGYFFVGRNTLMVIDYSGYSKYKFGSAYESFTLMYSEQHQEDFIYDDRFVSFYDTYMTIHDGNIEYDFETIDEENNIRSASISKSDYKKLQRVSIK